MIVFPAPSPMIEDICERVQPRQAEVLRFLNAHRGAWVSVHKLTRHIYGVYTPALPTIRKHVWYLRKALPADITVLSKRGLGYKLDVLAHSVIECL